MKKTSKKRTTGSDGQPPFAGHSLGLKDPLTCPTCGLPAYRGYIRREKRAASVVNVCRGEHEWDVARDDRED